MEVTVRLAVLPLALVTPAVVPDTDNVASPTACVTVTVLSVAPVAFIVIVATRVVINGFSELVVKVIVPSPVAPEVTVSQL